MLQNPRSYDCLNTLRYMHIPLPGPAIGNQSKSDGMLQNHRSYGCLNTLRHIHIPLPGPAV